MTVGSRHWGRWWDGRGVLGVKLYDFAVYIDESQMHRSSLARIVRNEGDTITSNRRFYHQLRSNDEIDMSIVVKASRNLPLEVMSMEYEKILKRRLIRVGGRTNDPSLHGFLDGFKPERLPVTLQDAQNNVKRGSIMRFQRHRGGTLTTFANDQKIGEVKSKDLCSALFDLYLGDEPVSVEAKKLAANRLIDMMADRETKRNSTTQIPPLTNAQMRLSYSATLF
eukprot:g49.t1